MRTSEMAVGERLETWRAQGADRMDLLAFHYLVALQRRLDGCAGAARGVLEQRLAERMATYAQRLEQQASGEGAVAGAGDVDVDVPVPVPVRPARGVLGALADEMAQRVCASQRQAVSAEGSEPTAPLELGVLDEVRKLWSRVRSDSQVQRSLAHSPTDAGPLNSGSLVHRSLVLMRELSPGYLEQFLAYVDVLAGLEQMKAAGVFAGKGTARAEGRARGKGRKRQ